MDEDLDVQIRSAEDSSPLIAGKPAPALIAAFVTPSDAKLPAVELCIDRHGGKPQLEWAKVIRRPDRPLRSEDMRVPVGRYIDAVIACVTEIEQPDLRVAIGSPDLEADDDDEPVKWETTRGQPITREQLEIVARLYRRAVARRKPTGPYIARRLGVKGSSAGRLVMKARAEGVLGKAKSQGVVGEVPAEAVATAESVRVELTN